MKASNVIRLLSVAGLFYLIALKPKKLFVFETGKQYSVDWKKSGELAPDDLERLTQALRRLSPGIQFLIAPQLYQQWNSIRTTFWVKTPFQFRFGDELTGYRLEMVETRGL